MSGTFILFLAFGYLLGSIPFGKLIGRRYGIDIQKHGSGNIGFANVRRTLGWRPGLVVLAGDVVKGFIPVMIAKQHLSTYQVLVVGISAVVGHIFPLWLKFKGGKGIATGLGVTLALSPLIGILATTIYLVALSFFRKSGPASVITAWCLPLLCLAITPKYALLYLGLALLATWTHRANLRQLRVALNAS
jgi:glycerol-3-phosphate acyltransferase PlsY